MCDVGWTSADCSKRFCDRNCSGHGVCADGVCLCQRGFSGSDCSTFPCLNDCSGHGACVNGTCSCDRFWFRQDCSLNQFFESMCPSNCSYRGSCFNGTCSCDRGWTGADCGIPLACTRNCSGHGVCLNASCLCDPHYFGYDCSSPMCPNNCSTHGVCSSNSTCTCDPGYGGLDCSLTVRPCGAGAGANCSGHGVCDLQAPATQWWSGSEHGPDIWTNDPESGHLARQDTGGCILDYFGRPLGLNSDPAQIIQDFTGGRRLILSQGVPDHFISSADVRPICQVSWALSLPLYPMPSSFAYPLPENGVIGVAINGVPIFGPRLLDGSNAVAGRDPVPCYGHPSHSGMWHYHHPSFGCNPLADNSTLVGYAIDGFPIFGPLSGSKELVDRVLDKCNGRYLPNGSYIYHVRTLLQVDANLPYKIRTENIETEWNYVLGCFVAPPVMSLGIPNIVSHKLGSATIAEKLGLLDRSGVCRCNSGWSGTDCSLRLCINNCSGHGICEINGTLGKSTEGCTCDLSWSGIDCSIQTNEIQPSGCFCSGHGTCIWENRSNMSFFECLCDSEWTGLNCSHQSRYRCTDNCSSHGSCVNGSCICDYGYSGQACEFEAVQIMSLNSSMCWQWIGSILSSSNCSGHGICTNGSCICDPGWNGVNCSAATDNGGQPKQVGCDNNCSYHGSCTFTDDPVHSTTNGTCTCDLGWGGKDCSLWLVSYFCLWDCSGHGKCINNSCACDFGWSGLNCANVSNHYLACAHNCSGHGTCAQGACICDMGWTEGPQGNCSVSVNCPSNCSGHGTCGDGNCTCDAGWAGLDCSHQSCYGSNHASNCTGHGICSKGNCSCDIGWAGSDCSVPICINSCSNNGYCRNGSCSCLSGYIGADCAGGPYTGECPHSCAGHGACLVLSLPPSPSLTLLGQQSARFLGSIGCVCDAGWVGSACEFRGCPNDCSRNGACAQNGSCFCYKYWSGLDCSNAWCPSNCSNRGTCTGGQGCVCDVGYQGLDCSLPSCPNNCSMNGICVASPGMELGLNAGENGYSYQWNNTAAMCLCLFGWAGDDCSQISCSLNCSFPNGLCVNGTCVCDQVNGYFGHNCSDRYGPYALNFDGSGLTPSYGIYLGGTIVTVRGTGFVNSGLLTCKFGDLVSSAILIQPDPPALPYAICRTPLEPGPRSVYFTFSLNSVKFSDVDPRVIFIFHSPGIISAVLWPTGPAQGGSVIRFTGTNFQYATAVLCKFGDTVTVKGSMSSFLSINGSQQLRQGLIDCKTPPLSSLGLPESAAQTVSLYMSMDAGRSWLQYGLYPYYKYYGATYITPSFGPNQDQNTIIRVFGFNFFQGLQMMSLVPGFSYAYTCRFILPWIKSPVVVSSKISTWNLVSSPNYGSYFSCIVPPGLTRGGGYYGPVSVQISLNPCLQGSIPSSKTSCVGALDYDSGLPFFYSSPQVKNLSVSLGPVRGGTLVTLRGINFDRRDTEPLPVSQHYPVLCQWGECTTSSGDDIQWGNCLLSPSCCSQGTFVSVDSSVVCPSPPCRSADCNSISLESCPSCQVSIPLEIALNGQDFTNSGLLFSYFKDPIASQVFPTLGPISGGTVITVYAEGLVDPCLNCVSIGNCNTCLQLTTCRFARTTPSSTVYVSYSAGSCVKLSDGSCDSSQIVCAVPDGNYFRDVNSILTVFQVSVSVSVNQQQFFPMNANGNPYDGTTMPGCARSQGVTTNCALYFMYYLLPIVTDVYPRAVSGDGGGRVTVTGSNFINLNQLTCVFGDAVGSPACSTGATCNDASHCTYGFQPCVSTIDASGKTVPCCQGPTSASPVFVSSTQVICPTLNLRRKDGVMPSKIRVGLSFNGQNGTSDISFLINISDTQQRIVEDALILYWFTSLSPSLGPVTGSTIVSVTVLNLDLAIFNQLDIDRSGDISPAEFGSSYAGDKSRAVNLEQFETSGLAYEFDFMMKCKFDPFIVNIIADLSLSRRRLVCARCVCFPSCFV